MKTMGGLKKGQSRITNRVRQRSTRQLRSRGWEGGAEDRERKPDKRLTFDMMTGSGGLLLWLGAT